MGKALLVYRLAVRDLRHHAAQAILLVVAIAAAAATLTMALSMNGVTSQPYFATRAATKGPDVVAYLTSTAQAKPLVHAPGVAGSSGPYPVASAVIRFDGRTAGVFAEGRSQAPAAVDQPDATAGSWVRPDGVVLERTFAEALGAGAGDVVTLNGQRFTVAGIAVTAAQPPYPNLCYFTGSSCPPWSAVPGGGTVIVTSGRRTATEDLITRRGWTGIDAETVWQMPTIFIGSAEQIRSDLRERRDRFGLSYLVAGDDAMPALAEIASGL